MCGIAGFTRFHTSPKEDALNNIQYTDFGSKPLLVAMGNTIAHRGPDAHGEHLDSDIGLCHRRLSIIDLSEAGTQPMYSADQQIIIVFNGEIYNFLELRKELELDGVSFATNTDTEVIIHLYQREGKDCVKKLNGMFAFALWDKNKKELFIARDRIGKKPLYYYLDPSQRLPFIFASEIKAILAVPEINRELSNESIYDFFAYQYIPDPKTIFSHIHKLKPGHTLTINAKSISISQYWDIDFTPRNKDAESLIKNILTNHIEKATKQRMISDVPLGAFLSGGVDSSGIVALMAKNNEKPVTTCSIGFDSKKYDEVEFAQLVANQYNTSHNEMTVRNSVEKSLEHIASFFDEPFADPSLVPTFFVSELAKEKVTVALAGDGGDEIFAGYEKYTTDNTENKLREIFPTFIRHTIFPAASKLFGLVNFSVCKKACSLLRSLSHEPSMGFYITNAQITDKDWETLAKPEFKLSLASYHPSKITTDYYNQCDANDHLSKILYTDMKTYLPGDILVKVDRMSMANSLEVRAPLLDHKVIEYSAKLPSSLKFNQGEKKYILKEIFKPLLSDDILYRKKMGFSVPLADWLRNEIKQLAEEKILSPTSGISQYFSTHAIQKFWSEHLSKKHDHSTLLWSLLMFELWHDNYVKEAS